MCSPSSALQIQISETTKALLDIYKEYNVKYRGITEWKSMSSISSYWLEGKRELESAKSVVKTYIDI